jgi:DNA-binding XRE family transcriptional regulator
MELNIEGREKAKVGCEATLVDIGDELAVLRKRFRLKQREVAFEIGVTASMVSKIERSLAKPSPEVASKLVLWVEEAHNRPPVNYPELKVCCNCKCLLHVSDFGIDRSRRNGLQSKCLKCNVVSVNNWRKKNWRRYLDKRIIKRKSDSSAKRLAGHHWGSNAGREQKELLQIVEPDTLRIRSFGKGSGQTIEMKNKSFYEEYGEKVGLRRKRGEISDETAYRLAALAARRPPTSFV